MPFEQIRMSCCMPRWGSPGFRRSRPRSWRPRLQSRDGDSCRVGKESTALTREVWSCWSRCSGGRSRLLGHTRANDFTSTGSHLSISGSKVSPSGHWRCSAWLPLQPKQVAEHWPAGLTLKPSVERSNQKLNLNHYINLKKDSCGLTI